MRATAKWIIVALGAVGAALLGAGPLVAVGRIHGWGAAAVAVAGLLLGIGGVGWAIWRTADALMPLATTLSVLDSAELSGLRQLIEAQPRTFFGSFGTSVRELEGSAYFWNAAAANAAAMLARQTDALKRQILVQGIADAQANAAQARARLIWLLELTQAWRVLHRLRRSRLHAFGGAAVAAIGGVLFILATSSGPFGGTR